MRQTKREGEHGLPRDFFRALPPHCGGREVQLGPAVTTWNADLDSVLGCLQNQYASTQPLIDHGILADRQQMLHKHFRIPTVPSDLVAQQTELSGMIKRLEALRGDSGDPKTGF